MLRRLDQQPARLARTTAATGLRPLVLRTVAPLQPLAVGDARRGFGAVARPSRSSVTALAGTEAVEAAAATPAAPLLSSYKLGDVVEGTVKSIEPYGAFIHLDNASTYGLLHSSEVSRESITSVDQILAKGERVRAMVIKVDAERKRLSLSTKRLEATPGAMIREKQLVFDNAEATAAAWMHMRGDREAEKAAGKEASRAAQLARMNAMAITVGDVVEGTVQSVQLYGVFLNIGGGTVGLLHVSEISGEKISSIDTVLRKGDSVKAVVILMDPTKGLSLSTKVLESTPGEMLRNKKAVYDNAEERAEARRAGGNAAPTADLQGFKVGDVVEGTVKTLQKRGAGVDLGNGAMGRLALEDIFHPSYTSYMYVNEVLRVGDKLTAAVKAVDQDRGRVVLSTKMLVAKPDLQGFKVGDVVEGTVMMVRPSLTRIDLGNGIFGTVPKTDKTAKTAPGSVGEVLKATVAAVNYDLGRLTLSV